MFSPLVVVTSILTKGKAALIGLAALVAIPAHAQQPAQRQRAAQYSPVAQVVQCGNPVNTIDLIRGRISTIQTNPNDSLEFVVLGLRDANNTINYGPVNSTRSEVRRIFTAQPGEPQARGYSSGEIGRRPFTAPMTMRLTPSSTPYTRTVLFGPTPTVPMQCRPDQPMVFSKTLIDEQVYERQRFVREQAQRDSTLQQVRTDVSQLQTQINAPDSAGRVNYGFSNRAFIDSLRQMRTDIYDRQDTFDRNIRAAFARITAIVGPRGQIPDANRRGQQPLVANQLQEQPQGYFALGAGASVLTQDPHLYSVLSAAIPLGRTHRSSIELDASYSGATKELEAMLGASVRVAGPAALYLAGGVEDPQKDRRIARVGLRASTGQLSITAGVPLTETAHRSPSETNQWGIFLQARLDPTPSFPVAAAIDWRSQTGGRMTLTKNYQENRLEARASVGNTIQGFVAYKHESRTGQPIQDNAYTGISFRLH